MKLSYQVVFLIVTGLLLSCKGEQTLPDPSEVYTDGIIVINGGNFAQNNGTLSFLKRDGKDLVENIFNRANGQASLPPQDGRVEGYAEAGQVGMILFDHSMIAGEDKVAFVDASTLKVRGWLGAPSIENPRDVVVISDSKAYISNWNSLNPDWTYAENGFIAVVNPQTGQVLKQIPAGMAPENMVRHQNKLYVGRASWTINELAVIDTDTDLPVSSISFSSSPTPIGIDANGKLWVKEGHRFHRVNTVSDEIEVTLPAGDDVLKSIGAATLTSDKTGIVFVLSYYGEDTNWQEVGRTYVTGISAPVIDLSRPILDRVFSALATDTKSNTLYAGVTPSQAQGGYVFRISPEGEIKDSVRAEVSPEGFFFK